METEIETEKVVENPLKAGAEIKKDNNTSHRKRWVVVFGVVVIALICYVLFQKRDTIWPKDRSEDTAFVEKYDAAYYAAGGAGRPEALQNLFEEDIKNGINDKYTKSEIYFITHRYFDNRGNIYEIYDYVNSRPSLKFLQVAELIYPRIFREIKEKKLPKSLSGDATFALLAYFEVLDKEGYADIATLSTAANQYAKLAYFVKKAPELMPQGTDIPKNIDFKVKKSIYFETKARQGIVDIFDGKITSRDIPVRDIIVGLNQYASALRYFEFLGVSFDSPKTAREIFAFSKDYAKQNDPGWSLFTGYVDASTLLYINAGSDEVRVALQPVLDYDVAAKKPAKGTLIDKVIKSRLDKRVDLDMYGRIHVVNLANKVPEFKAWLVINGWIESDFK